MVLVLFKNTVLVFYMNLAWPKNQSSSCLPWSYLAERYDVPSLVWYEIKQDSSLISLHHQFVPVIKVNFILNGDFFYRMGQCGTVPVFLRGQEWPKNQYHSCLPWSY